jgi:dolichol kinase
MTAAVAPSVPHDSRDLALELHQLLKQLDPARWRPDLDALVRSRLHAVRTALGKLLERFDAHGSLASLHAALARAWEILGELPAPDLSERAARRAWKRLFKQLQRAYDALSKSLEAWDIHVPALRPTNYARNVFHVAWASTALGILWALPDQGTLLAIIVPFAALAWTLEITRRRSKRLNAFLMTVLGPVAHPHEAHRVNSATWYSTAVLVLAWSGVLTASVVALAVLGLGDPAAAIVGRRFGRTRLVHGRSLEGTLAFVVFGGGAALGMLRLTHPEIAWGPALLATLAGAVAGALAELFSRRIDDNLSIPLTSAAATAFVLGLLGFRA